jgi:hypothetical protein
MKTEIKKILDNFPDDLEVIKKQATRYCDYDDKAAIRKDGAVQIFNRTWVAPFNFGLLLFPAAHKQVINRCEKRSKKKIPSKYKDILTCLNGCFIYDFVLFGLPKSIYKKGMLDRSDVYQFDIGIANNDWILEYDIGPGYFYFGGRAYTFNENIGYFMDEKERIHAIRTSGQILKSWRSFRRFMTDEVSEAEKIMRKELPKNFKKR